MKEKDTVQDLDDQKTNYSSVSVPKSLKKAFKEEIKINQLLGTFRSFSEFAIEAIRKSLIEYKKLRLKLQG